MAIKDLTQVQRHLFLCNGGTCKQNGSEESSAAIRKAIADAGLNNEIHTTKTLCNGRCKDGPIVISQPEGIWFKQMATENVAPFVKTFLLDGIIPKQLYLFRYGLNKIHAVERETIVE